MPRWRNSDTNEHRFGRHAPVIQHHKAAVRFAYSLTPSPKGVEYCVWLFMTASQRLRFHSILQGSADRVPLVITDEIEAAAAHPDTDRIYCLHNHPIGRAKPSPGDQRAIQRVQELAAAYHLMLGSLVWTPPSPGFFAAYTHDDYSHPRPWRP